MAKKKNKYTVRLYGTLPCSATMEVEAESEEAAREYADEHFEKADWDGADYSTPEGATVGIAEVTKI